MGLRSRLSRARDAWSSQLASVRASEVVDEQTWQDLGDALLLADVGVATADELLAEVRQRVGRLNALLSNNLLGIATVKSFTAEAREVERVRTASADYMASNRRAIALSSAFSPLIRMVIVFGFVATLLYGGFLTLEGELGVGAYSVLVFLTQRLLCR